MLKRFVFRVVKRVPNETVILSKPLVAQRGIIASITKRKRDPRLPNTAKYQPVKVITFSPTEIVILSKPSGAAKDHPVALITKTKRDPRTIYTRFNGGTVAELNGFGRSHCQSVRKQPG